MCNMCLHLLHFVPKTNESLFLFIFCSASCLMKFLTCGEKDVFSPLYFFGNDIAVSLF